MRRLFLWVCWSKAPWNGCWTSTFSKHCSKITHQNNTPANSPSLPWSSYSSKYPLGLEPRYSLPSWPTKHRQIRRSTPAFRLLYGKIGRFNPSVSEALVRHSAVKLEPLLKNMPPAAAEPIVGYRMRVLDGNVLTGTDHRLSALRKWLNACLPGKSLVVYEPALGVVSDLVLCEDAYTQERALLIQLLPRVQANDLWVADRNFCTTKFVFGVKRQQGLFLVRQHRTNLPCQRKGRRRRIGETETGVVYEQQVVVTDPETDEQLTLRRIELKLFEKTRDGERTLALLTNLPDTVCALTIAKTYRLRWTIETHFQFLTQSLHCEGERVGQTACVAVDVRDGGDGGKCVGVGAWLVA